MRQKIAKKGLPAVEAEAARIHKDQKPAALAAIQECRDNQEDTRHQEQMRNDTEAIKVSRQANLISIVSVVIALSALVVSLGVAFLNKSP